MSRHGRPDQSDPDPATLQRMDDPVFEVRRDARPDDQPWQQATWPPPAGTRLTGRWIELTPTTPDDIGGLRVALDHEAVHRHIAGGPVPDDDAMRRWYDAVIGRDWHPWTIRLRADVGERAAGAVVGWSSYLEIAPNVALSTKLGQLRVRGGGVSIGKPSRGKLVRGVELPERPDLYTRRKPEEEFGSTHTIAQMLAAFTRFRHDSGYKGQVVIGGISRPRGGRFRPHKSHQSGRDVDIRLPLLPGSQDKKHPTSADVDWRATWNLMRAFLDTGEVEYIFLDYRLQKKIYKAAREAGARREQLDLWLQWPAKPRTNKGVIRHVEGHRAHMHVRIRCGPQEKHCYSQR